jgi:hypothetical protein
MYVAGDWRRVAFSPTRSGAKASSRNEILLGRCPVSYFL